MRGVAGGEHGDFLVVEFGDRAVRQAGAGGFPPQGEAVGERIGLTTLRIPQTADPLVQPSPKFEALPGIGQVGGTARDAEQRGQARVGPVLWVAPEDRRQLAQRWLGIRHEGQCAWWSCVS